MGIFGDKPLPGSSREQMEQACESELARWHEENPLRTFLVTYAGMDGVPLNDKTPERVRAHNFSLQGEAGAAVFRFNHVTPSIANYASYSIKEFAVQPLTVPFDRIHSINMVMEEPADTDAARSGE